MGTSSSRRLQSVSTSSSCLTYKFDLRDHSYSRSATPLQHHFALSKQTLRNVGSAVFGGGFYTFQCHQGVPYNVYKYFWLLVLILYNIKQALVTNCNFIYKYTDTHTAFWMFSLVQIGVFFINKKPKIESAHFIIWFYCCTRADKFVRGGQTSDSDRGPIIYVTITNMLISLPASYVAFIKW